MILLQVGTVVGQLLERGANVDIQGPDDNTPLHYAAFHGFHHVARKLLEKGADVEKMNKKHQTALEIAASNYHCEFTVLMINRMQHSR